MPMPPIAGHHIQCTVQMLEHIFKAVHHAAHRRCTQRPTTAPSSNAPSATRDTRGNGNCGHGEQRPAPEPDNAQRGRVTLAIATGTRLRGLHSKSSNSTAIRIAATGVANVADMPAAAPATSSVVRSASVRCIHCATSDPTAPPVIMIGPSAPKGPPDPIAIAAEIGFKQRNLRIHFCAMKENRFDRLWNSVAPDLVRTKPRHQSHQETA